MARFGYYADLRGIQFSEGNKSWITAMRVGEYQHPTYGKISFTADRLKRFADSVKNKVRGIALDIDYDHKQDLTKGHEAAGWVEDVKVEGDSLMLLVEWTKSATEKIREKAYRYFSPEFQDEWQDSQGITHRDVLFGGGITNRPFLKDLLPVNLSELAFEKQLTETKKEGNGMDPKALRKKLGLPEDATDEQVLAKIDSLNNPANVDKTATTHGPDAGATSAPQGQIGGVPYDASTANKVDKDGNVATPEDVQLSELAKTNPAIAILLAERVENRKRFAELEQANKIAQINVKLSEYRTGDKVVAPAILDEAAKLLHKLPISLHEDVHGLIKSIQSLGGNVVVQLGEVGSTGQVTQRAGGKSATEEAEAMIATQRKQFKETTGNELSYADAMTDVFASNPDLYRRYQTESYSFQA
jgi:hypothetical protein